MRESRSAGLGRGTVALAALLALLFLSIPVGALLWRALVNGGLDRMSAPVVQDALLLSLDTTTRTLVLTLLFGTPLAYAFARWRFPGRRVLGVLIELPIVLPPSVAGLALLAAFGRRGIFGPALSDIDVMLPFTTWAVVVAQLFVAAPFYIRSAQIGFLGVPREIEEAARVDGAGGLALFGYVTLPLARRALGAGLVLCWARAVGEFGATLLFAGNLRGETQTMPLLIESTRASDLNAANATGAVLIGMALAALLLSRWLLRDDEAQAEGST